MTLNKSNRPVKETTVILFGSPSDPEVKTSINKVAITGRKTKVYARPSFDTGLGKCGKHLCSCKHVCLEEYSKLEQKFL